MPLLDFREIASAQKAYNARQDLPVGVSSSVDDFELFAQEFFTSVKKMKIFKSVSNGPDAGIDLGVEDAAQDRWLVSCKHYAHGDNPVPHDKESGIIERVIAWGCIGFIGFYTTVPTSTLAQQISSAKQYGFKVETYTKERIEAELLESSMGTLIAARYFPKSMSNHYRKLIRTLDEFSASDVLVSDGLARLGNMSYPFEEPSEAIIEMAKARLVYMENLRVTAIQHQPYFTAAIRDAVNLVADYFQVDPRVASHFQMISPTWDFFKLGNESSLENIYFIAAVWSFWDWCKAGDCLAQALAVRSLIHLGEITDEKTLNCLVSVGDYKESVEDYRASGLLNVGWISRKLPELKRDIVGRLFLYGQAGIT